MPMLKERDADIHVLRGKELEYEIDSITSMEGIDLSLADMDKTKAILSSVKSSLSEEIVNTRDNTD